MELLRLTYGFQADCLERTGSYRLYHLPQMELYVLLFNQDGQRVRLFEQLPSLEQVADELSQRSTETGWKELEREVRHWWWVRLLHNLNHPSPEEPDCWPQRWADLAQLAPPI